jgi:hypothetical protein
LRFFFLDDEEASRSDMSTPPNGTIHVESKILRTLCLQPPRLKLVAFFHNCQAPQNLHHISRDGHNHPLSSNAITTAKGIANDTVNPDGPKAMDMRFGGYVIVSARPIQIQWAPGSTNKADYFTKHFALRTTSS